LKPQDRQKITNSIILNPFSHLLSKQKKTKKNKTRRTAGGLRALRHFVFLTVGELLLIESRIN